MRPEGSCLAMSGYTRGTSRSRTLGSSKLGVQAGVQLGRRSLKMDAGQGQGWGAPRGPAAASSEAAEATLHGGWEPETNLMEEAKELQTILKVDSNKTSNLCLFQTTQHQRYINTDGLDPCSGIVARSQVNRFSRSSPESRDRLLMVW